MLLVGHPNHCRQCPSDLGPFEVLEEIGRGGMGVVYRARHRVLTGREAAIKVLRPGEVTRRNRSFSDSKPGRSRRSVIRTSFSYEIVVPENADDSPFVALEYIEGGTLSQRIDGRPFLHGMPPLLLPLAEAMSHWRHDRGIVHRDLKPSNI